ncbi:MAG TPA: lasso peptide biosynthesis B2 protein [Chloroflexota bacterium]|nr:lasso peptide biosynthesis B2 protein [Chloroflexota bacterium]
MSSWSSRLASRRAVLDQVKSPRDAVLVARILTVAAAVPLLMRLPLPRVSALLEPRRIPPHPVPTQEDRTVRLVLALLSAGRPLVRRGCLTRGVTLYYFLRRAGVDVSLCFGMGTSTEKVDGFDGHCWLVKQGEPYLESRDPRSLYTAMYSFPWAPTSRAGA